MRHVWRNFHSHRLVNIVELQLAAQSARHLAFNYSLCVHMRLNVDLVFVRVYV